MFVKHLSLTNFRNYGRLDLALTPGVTLLHGANAQGKTNLLEALYYMATTRSPHATQDNQLIHWEADRFGDAIAVGRIVVHLQVEAGSRHLEMRLIQETSRGQSTFRREALVDRRKVRLMDLLGNMRVVMFLPQDVNLITGPPADRRRYVNITLCQSDRAYCQSLAGYNKVLEQRNALLRQIAERGRADSREADLLAVLTEQLVSHGAPIMAGRARFMAGLARRVRRIHYESLTAQQETLQLRYLPRWRPVALQRDAGNWALFDEDARWLAEQTGDVAAVGRQFDEQLAAVRDQEMARGRTLIGPHRDDWRFWVNGRSLEMFGSRGQQRTAILALKMAEVDWVAESTGTAPVLLLDDVMAELDNRRRRLLQTYLLQARQAFVTATDLTVFAGEFLKEARLMEVVGGRLLV